MEVTITARHCAVPDSLRQRAEQRLMGLSRFDPRILSASVAFAGDHGSHTAEVRVHSSGGQNLIATGSGDTFQTSLETAIDRVARQLKRRREKLIDKKAAGPAATP